ncbi:MAG: FtsK/SpoIIIE domain-containing protein [Candidatus Odinarchaeota archaeon]
MKRLYKDSLFEALGQILLFLGQGLLKLRYVNKKDLIYIVSSIVSTTLIVKTQDIYIHTKSLMYIIALIVIFLAATLHKIEKKSFIDKFYRAGLIENSRMIPNYYHTRNKKGNKVVRIGIQVPITKVISKLSFLSKMLNFNIIDINMRSKYLLGYKCIDITLSKENSPYKLLLLEKLYLALYRLIDDIKNIEHKEELTTFLITFNSEKTFKTVKNFENELMHRCKKNEGELIVNSHLRKDYCIVIKKNLKFEMDFLKLYENNKNTKKTIPWIAGYNENSGALEIFDLKDFIHLIIAGASGNGKSNVIHTILLSILLFDKEDVEFYIMDPKINEFKSYRSLKNIKYFNDFDSISRAIKGNVQEMKKRNKLIEKDDYIRDIDGYNKKYTINKMKYRLIIIDEIADLMLNPDKKLVDEFSDNINKLAQTSRNIGFRLILSTQNPTKDVLKKFIKANIQSRVAMGTSNKTDSRTILDNNMASEIESPGKFVLQFNKKNAFYYSPFIPDKVLVDALNYIKQHSRSYLESENNVPALISSSETLREKISQGVKVEIDNSKTLYNFYINLQQTNNILPIKKEIKQYTNLSDHQLRKLNEELKQQGLLKLIDNKKLKVIDIDNELEVKRLKKTTDKGRC